MGMCFANKSAHVWFADTEQCSSNIMKPKSNIKHLRKVLWLGVQLDAKKGVGYWQAWFLSTSQYWASLAASCNNELHRTSYCYHNWQQAAEFWHGFCENYVVKICLLPLWRLPALELWKECVFPKIYASNPVCKCKYIIIYPYPIQYCSEGVRIWSLVKISGGRTSKLERTCSVSSAGCDPLKWTRKAIGIILPHVTQELRFIKLSDVATSWLKSTVERRGNTRAVR